MWTESFIVNFMKMVFGAVAEHLAQSSSGNAREAGNREGWPYVSQFGLDCRQLTGRTARRGAPPFRGGTRHEVFCLVALCEVDVSDLARTRGAGRKQPTNAGRYFRD
jgi:hypothetical protein